MAEDEDEAEDSMEIDSKIPDCSLFSFICANSNLINFIFLSAKGQKGQEDDDNESDNEEERIVKQSPEEVPPYGPGIGLFTALHFLVKQKSDSDLLKLLITTYNANINAQDYENHTTPLILATQTWTAYAWDLVGYPQCDVNLADKNKVSPLHHAVQKKNNQLVSYLINRGAAVNSTDNHKRYGLFLSSKKKKTWRASI